MISSSVVLRGGMKAFAVPEVVFRISGLIFTGKKDAEVESTFDGGEVKALEQTGAEVEHLDWVPLNDVVEIGVKITEADIVRERVAVNAEEVEGMLEIVPSLLAFIDEEIK